MIMCLAHGRECQIKGDCEGAICEGGGCEVTFQNSPSMCNEEMELAF